MAVDPSNLGTTIMGECSECCDICCRNFPEGKSLMVVFSGISICCSDSDQKIESGTLNGTFTIPVDEACEAASYSVPNYYTINNCAGTSPDPFKSDLEIILSCTLDFKIQVVGGAGAGGFQGIGNLGDTIENEFTSCSESPGNLEAGGTVTVTIV